MAEKLLCLSDLPTYRAIKAASKNDYFDICHRSQRDNDIAQFAARPLLVGLFIAFVVAVILRETYPRKQSQLL